MVFGNKNHVGEKRVIHSRETYVKNLIEKMEYAKLQT